MSDVPGVEHGWENQYRDTKGRFTRARIRISSNWRDKSDRSGNTYGTSTYTFYSAFRIGDLDEDGLVDLLNETDEDNAHWDAEVIEVSAIRGTLAEE